MLGNWKREHYFISLPYWICPLAMAHRKKNKSHFDLKTWVTCGTKFWPGISSNWRLFEILNWVDIESQFYSKIIKFLEIPGQNLVPPVTHVFRSKWRHFFFQGALVSPKHVSSTCKASRRNKSIWSIGKIAFCN